MKRRIGIVGLALILLGLIASSVSAAPRIVTLDGESSNDGSNSSLQLNSSGHPVVAYTGNTGLELVVCNTPDCSGTPTYTTVDAGLGIGASPALQLNSSGNPVIAYIDTMPPATAKLAVCDDPICSTSTITDIARTATTAFHLDMQLNSSGNPIIAYQSYLARQLDVAICNDARCTAPNIVTVDDDNGGTNFVGSFLSLKLLGDIPIISHFDNIDRDLKLSVCSDVACTSSNNFIVDNFSGVYTSLQLDGGIPVISYNGNGFSLAKCNDLACGASDITVLASIIGSSNATSLQLDGNVPVMSFRNDTNLELYRCADATCTLDAISMTIVDDNGDVGFNNDLQLNGDLPVISYFDLTNYDLKIAICDTPTCAIPNYSSAPNAGDTLAISGDNATVATASLMIFNDGDDTSLLNVSVDSITSGYTVVGLPITGLTPADGNATLTIDCTVGTSPATGQIVLTTDDRDTPTVTYDLSCNETEIVIIEPPSPQIVPTAIPVVIASPLDDVTSLPATGETPFWRNWAVTIISILGVSLTLLGIYSFKKQS